MDTNELKAAIERVRERIHSRGLSCDDQMNDVLTLAEIGRLAVEQSRIGQTPGASRRDYYNAEDAVETAADAFLAARKGGK